MRTFSVYRPTPPDGYVEGGFAVEAEKPQFQGVVFDDGTVAIRWFTLSGSTAIWPTLADLEQIHGHPEYGTRWVWDDEPDLRAHSREDVEWLVARVRPCAECGCLLADCYDATNPWANPRTRGCCPDCDHRAVLNEQREGEHHD